MNDSHLYKIARECSLESDYNGNARVGAIVVYKNAILARGHNGEKTHTQQDKYNKYRYKNSSGRYLPSKVHAEVACLSKIKYLDIDFAKVHIYVYRELKNGQVATSKPCAACMAYIRELGIKHLHYTGNNSYIYEKLI